jgi:hypothetical protein
MASDNELLTKILEQLQTLGDEVKQLSKHVERIRAGSYEPPKGRSTDLRL